MAGEQGERKPWGKQGKLRPSGKKFKRHPSGKPKGVPVKTQEKRYAWTTRQQDEAFPYPPGLYQGDLSQGQPRIPRPGLLPHGSPYSPPPQHGGPYNPPLYPPQYQGYPAQEYPSQGYPLYRGNSYPSPPQYGGPYHPPPHPPQYPPPLQQGGPYHPCPVYSPQVYSQPQREWSRIRQLVTRVGEGIVMRVGEDMASNWISGQVAPSDCGGS